MSMQVNGGVAKGAPANHHHQPNNLYVMVKTYNSKAECIGTRVVDQMHYGTPKWLTKHVHWAALRGHGVTISPATPAEVTKYVTDGTQKLQERFAA